MKFWEAVLYGLKEGWPLILTLIIGISLYLVIPLIFKRKTSTKNDKKILQQGLRFAILLAILIVGILVSPLSDTKSEQVMKLVGIVLSAIFALSSASLVGNVLAGFMLRIVNNFKPGDYIEIKEIYGRVSERSLFHTELQTIDSDLITLPNLFLATNPVKVKRTSGTFISAEVSLGYDVSRIKVEKCLLEAAERAGLLDAFIYITSLGDYSIVYEVHGKLSEVKKFITARSLLRAMILDVLHEAKIEIVSPSFMNQRQVNEQTFIPRKAKQTTVDTQTTAKPEDVIFLSFFVEDVIFDKAEKAESIEKRKGKIDEIEAKIKELQAQLKEAQSPEDKASVLEKIEKAKRLKEKILSNIEIVQERMEEND